MGKHITTSTLLWAVYLALLAVLLPHTAWLFLQFEDPAAWYGPIAAWAAAFAFESAIAALTHKLAKHIESVKTRKRWQRTRERYLNAYAAGLVIAVGVSALANLAHAVEFGGQLEIFADWGIPPKFYQLSFGAILPLVSLVFARVLSNVNDTEHEPNAELDQANATIRQLRADIRRIEKERSPLSEDALIVFGDGEKAERIRAARRVWPEANQSAIAQIVGASSAYVSEVLSSE